MMMVMIFLQEKGTDSLTYIYMEGLTTKQIWFLPTAENELNQILDFLKKYEGQPNLQILQSSNIFPRHLWNLHSNASCNAWMNFGSCMLPIIHCYKN